MYYVITKKGVYNSGSLEKINNSLNAKIEESEMKAVGPDFITNLDDIDLDFVQDKRKMSAIAFNNFFRKDSRPTIYAIIQIILLVIILFAK